MKVLHVGKRGPAHQKGLRCKSGMCPGEKGQLSDYGCEWKMLVLPETQKNEKKIGNNSSQDFGKQATEEKGPERRNKQGDPQLTSLRKCPRAGEGAGSKLELGGLRAQGDSRESRESEELRIYKTKYWRGENCPER